MKTKILWTEDLQTDIDIFSISILEYEETVELVGDMEIHSIRIK